MSELRGLVVFAGLTPGVGAKWLADAKLGSSPRRLNGHSFSAVLDSFCLSWMIILYMLAQFPITYCIILQLLDSLSIRIVTSVHSGRSLECSILLIQFQFFLPLFQELGVVNKVCCELTCRCLTLRALREPRRLRLRVLPF